MVHLTIKEIKKQLHIHVKFDSFEELEEQLPLRLAPLSHGKSASAFFYLPSLSDAQALAFLRLCKAMGVRLLGINDEKRSNAQPICYWEGNVRNGERFASEGPVQLFGSIRRSAQVRAGASLSVFGEVSGVIDLLYPDCVLYAALLDNARVRIADSPFVSFSCAQPCKIVYEQQSLKCISAL